MSNVAIALTYQDQRDGTSDRLEEARELVEDVLARRKKVLGQHNFATLYSIMHLATVLHREGKWKDACRLHEEVQALPPEVLPVNQESRLESMNDLAWLLANCEAHRLRDPARAVALASQTTTLAPKDAISWLTLGVARYRAGDWKGSVAALNKCPELSKDVLPCDWQFLGGDSTHGFFLAMAHWQLGNKVEARDLFHRAVTWMDENRPKDKDLIRFRAEAAALLGIDDPPASPCAMLWRPVGAVAYACGSFSAAKACHAAVWFHA
jgi:tetratricopeptide (TPR) repeat protein